MRITVVMPIFIQNEDVLNMTIKNATGLQSGHEAELLVMCNRLHCIAPGQLAARLRSACKMPVEVMHEPFRERSVGGAWNMGIKMAFANGSRYAVVTANDVLHTHLCLDRLVEFGESNPWVDLWSGIDARNRTSIDESVVTDGCDFSCAMLRPETIEKIGYFDEKFRPAYFEDNDYCARVWMSGGVCRIVHGAQFYHYGSQTIQLDPDARRNVDTYFANNRKRFVEKWGSPPVNSQGEALASYFKHPWNNPGLPIKFCDL